MIKTISIQKSDGTGYIEDVIGIDAFNIENLNNGAGISIVDDSTDSSKTIALETSGARAGSYGPTQSVIGSNGTVINVPQITVDEYGRITDVVERKYTSVNTAGNDIVLTQEDYDNLVTKDANAVYYIHS